MTCCQSRYKRRLKTQNLLFSICWLHNVNLQRQGPCLSHRRHRYELRPYGFPLPSWFRCHRYQSGELCASIGMIALVHDREDRGIISPSLSSVYAPDVHGDVELKTSSPRASRSATEIACATGSMIHQLRRCIPRRPFRSWEVTAGATRWRRRLSAMTVIISYTISCWKVILGTSNCH